MDTLDPRLDHARRLLDESDLGLDALGAAVGLSPTHLQRRFRQSFGLSPAEYRAQRRLAAFKRELRAAPATARPDGTVTRAVYEAGYGSPSRVYTDGAALRDIVTVARRRFTSGRVAESLMRSTIEVDPLS